MTVVESYAVAVTMCVVTMFCWGSWANTQKLATKEWRFELFYWDYAIGVLLFALVLAFTSAARARPAGASSTTCARRRAERWCRRSSAGSIFNLSNILLVAAIDIAGMAVAFPIGVGLALVLGVITNYMASPVGNAALLFLGVGCVVLAHSALPWPTAGCRRKGRGRWEKASSSRSPRDS